MSIFYHATSPEAAAAIREGGFIDHEGTYLFTTLILRGVFISDIPVGQGEGTKGETLLEIVLPDSLALDYWELAQEGGPVSYREWCVPAALLNRAGTVRLLDDEEADEAWVRGNPLLGQPPRD